MSDLSVVVVSWNVRDLLARCLESLFFDLASTALDCRVVVVDNASHDGSVEMIRSRFPHVELIASETNLGFAGGNNTGLRALGFSGPHPPPPPGGTSSSLSRQTGEGGRGWREGGEVLLLNPDTEIQPGALNTLLDAMQALPHAAVITSQLTYGDGSFQHSAFRFPGLTQLYIDLFPVPARLRESRLNGRYPRRWYSLGAPFEIDHPLGAVMLVRGEAIRQVGLFDEVYALYCEEIDWCARFKMSGWRNYCVPQARIVHHSGQSTTQAKSEAFVKLWVARYRLHVNYPHFAPMTLAKRIVRGGMRRKMRNASEKMQAACRQIMDVWK